MLLKDYESAIARAPTPEAVWATVSEFFRDTVVDRVVYLHLPPIGAPDSSKPRLRAEGFPEELMIRYLGERLYRDNPVLRQTHQRAEPIYWDEIWEHGPANERERAFLEEFRKADLGDGVGIPVFGPDGRLGPVWARVSEGRAAAGPGGAEGVPVGLRAGASAVLRAPGAGARAAAEAVAPRDRDSGLGCPRQEQPPDRGDTRDFEQHRRCALAAYLSEARGLRPDQRCRPRDRDRADPRS